jgi:rhodanese-related sulfurtransferase
MTSTAAEPRTSNVSGASGRSASFLEAPPHQVQQWLQAGEAVLIDVREPDEHVRERIAGSSLLPLSRFDPRQAAALAAPGRRIVMQCRSGRRSADACRMVASISGPDAVVVNLTGGIVAWKEANLPVETTTSVTSISVMRQVQMVIGLGTLGGSALAWFVHPAFVALPAFFGMGLTFAGATGTCALAHVIGKMPWNRPSTCAGSCAGGCSTPKR